MLKRLNVYETFPDDERRTEDEQEVTRFISCLVQQIVHFQSNEQQSAKLAFSATNDGHQFVLLMCAILRNF